MDSKIKLYQGDCLEYMKDFLDQSIDLVLCDLPYTFTGKERVTANSWDLPIDDNKLWAEYTRLIKPNGAIVLFATNPFSAYLIMQHLDLFKYEWIWEKDNGSNFVHVKYQPFRVHEQILVFGKAPTTYNKSENYMTYNPQYIYSEPYIINRDGSDVTNLAGFSGRSDTSNQEGKRYPRSVQRFNLERGYHPTQKPVPLLEYLIKTYTDSADATVLDNCMGSGSTGVAAKHLNRNFIGIELDPEYFKIAEQRIYDEESMIANKGSQNNSVKNQMSLFDLS